MPVLMTRETVLQYKCRFCDARGYTDRGHVRVDHTLFCERWLYLNRNYPKLVRMIFSQRRNKK